MTSVCSVGLDMIAAPAIHRPVPYQIIADEAAIGMINRKTTAVRIIPVPNKSEGEWVEFGGLLGRAPVMSVSKGDSRPFVDRKGRIPAPIQALNN